MTSHRSEPAAAQVVDATVPDPRFTARWRRLREQGWCLIENLLPRSVLAALEAGLPACAGVAVGLDRLLTLLLELPGIAHSKAFDDARA